MSSCMYIVETDLIPLKKFVQELLCRARSTCSTLQTAICYIEAIRRVDPEYRVTRVLADTTRGKRVIILASTVAFILATCTSAGNAGQRVLEYLNIWLSHVTGP